MWASILKRANVRFDDQEVFVVSIFNSVIRDDKTFWKFLQVPGLF